MAHLSKPVSILFSIISMISRFLWTHSLCLGEELQGKWHWLLSANHNIKTKGMWASLLWTCHLHNHIKGTFQNFKISYLFGLAHQHTDVSTWQVVRGCHWTASQRDGRQGWSGRQHPGSRSWAPSWGLPVEWLWIQQDTLIEDVST